MIPPESVAATIAGRAARAAAGVSGPSRMTTGHAVGISVAEGVAMHTHVKTVDCILARTETETLERRIARLERVTPRLAPDLLHLRLVIERHPRRLEFRCSLRLTMKDRVLAATRQHSGSIRTLLIEAFDRLETQLNRVRELKVERRTRDTEADAGAA